MATRAAESVQRQRAAREALAALGSPRAQHQRLAVQCPRSHHVAFVYETTSGLVFWSRTGPHAHGSKDFVDTNHHGGKREEFVDFVSAPAAADDTLHAWCDCGPRELTRRELVDALFAGVRTLRVS